MNIANSKIVLVLLVSLLNAVLGDAIAQQKNKVVVVPLGGGDVSTADFNALQAKVQELLSLQSQVQELQQRAPFAYGRVLANGGVVPASGTDNFTVIYNTNVASDRYEIIFDGPSFSINSNSGLATISGPSESCPGGADARVSSVSGRMLVYIEAANGDALQCGFFFAAYGN